MASLNKLAIRGIRSFDDKHVQVIEFYSPLTVIVGHNGSGKTTIIECLKYATTGDLPPNTKGGAFVHDPKMANEKEVKAQVRLRFWNVNRQRMTATRSLQVTMKKGGGLTMKTLEGLLAKTEADGGEGKRNTISTKCADMDEEIPLLLGVSKAILENVIFCHQEESNWPLSEPAALKKKFDDIFEATKYTKALDNIKLLRKERTAELKVDKERLKFLKQDKDKAERMRKELQDHIRLENTKTTEAEQLKEQHTRLKQLNMEHYEKASTFQRTFERLDRLNAQKTMLKGNSDSLLQGMKPMDETTEELLHMRNNFDSHINKISAKKDKQIELRDKEDTTLEDLRRKERNLASIQGGLLANKRAYEKNLKEREAAVREVAKNHNFAGYDYSPLEDHKIAEFVEKVHDMVRKADADLKKLQADGQRKERELQAELDRLAGIKTSAVATRKSKQDQITQLNSRIRTAESNFESVSTVDTDITVTEDRLSNSRTQLQKLQEDMTEARYDEQIRERTFTIRQREADRDKANGELAALNRQADSRAQLGIKRTERDGKKGSVEAMVESHRVRFGELVGGELVAETMEENITSAIHRKDRELQDAETSASASNRQFSQLQTSVNIAKQSLKSKSDEISRLEKSVRDALSTFTCDTVEEAITEAVAELELRQAELANASSMKAIWENIFKTGRTKKKCYGCDRALHENETATFETYVKARIAKCSSAGIEDLKSEAAQWESELVNLRRVAPSEANIKDLRERVIPELEKQVADETAQLSSLQDEVEETKEKVQRAKMASRDLQTLKGAATLLTRTLTEIKDLAMDVKRLERDLESSGSLKTVDEVQKEVDQINDTIKTLQREQNTLSSDKELKQSTIRGISDDINKHSLRLGELKSQREKQRLAEEALKELRESLTQLQADLKDLEASAQAAEGPWREKNDALNRYRNERQNAENDASLQVGIYQSSLGEIESKHRSCQSYVSEGNDRKIWENEANIDDIKREISAANESRMNIEAVIQTLQSEEATAGNLKTNIASNLNYREQLKAIAKVQEELDGIDVEAAAKARREFETKYAQKVEEENTVHSKWQLRNGELLQMAENRKKLNATLQSDYKDVDKKFTEQLVKTKSSEIANNDLEKYGKALDNAILRYHAIKMDEINDTIGHLWNKTYQGTDIDGIKIVSDNDESGTTTTRKSYNYRVVMLKNEVELDMRGRCSAGQKVLASIIIRLALAESFGQGCGVLALDEPTTNLDQENINALAEALAEIIRERRRQANFQLIVITHDEGFLQRLAGHDVLEYYWRVSRDASQKSVLERQRIAM